VASLHEQNGFVNDAELVMNKSLSGFLAPNNHGMLSP
jgi:hypothetical protein